ncbi:hypothetical protein CIB84_017610, partial [Bambusicola thoracicus]
GCPRNTSSASPASPRETLSKWARSKARVLPPDPQADTAATHQPHHSRISFPTEAVQDAAAAQLVDLACCPAAACQHTRSPPAGDAW